MHLHTYVLTIANAPLTDLTDLMVSKHPHLGCTFMTGFGTYDGVLEPMVQVTVYNAFRSTVDSILSTLSAHYPNEEAFGVLCLPNSELVANNA